LDYATIFHAKQGESISAINRNIPGSDFEKSMIVFLRVLGLPLGMPLELVMLDWTKSNYSQSRAVLQQAFQTFTYWQNMIKARSLSRIYKRKVSEWIQSGKLAGIANADKHEWIAPSFPWIDEAKELDAQGRKIELSLTSHAEVCKALQHDPEQVLLARDNEIRAAIKRATAIKDETGVDVPWQYFAGLSMVNKSTPPPIETSDNAPIDGEQEQEEMPEESEEPKEEEKQDVE